MGEAQRYKDKVTIVTGGSKGIGRGCAEIFVQNGSKVVIADNDEDGGKSSEIELNQKGPGEAFFVYCDVTKETDIKNLIDKTVDKYGQIDCVINNAGCHPPYQKIEDISADDFRMLLDVNVVSYFLVVKYAMPYLRRSKGNIIQTSSMVAQHGQPGAIPYCATKGAITSMTKALAIDEAIHDIRMNSFSPSAIQTPLLEKFIQANDNPEKARQSGADKMLLGRIGTPEECGRVCLFLAADATFCTGLDINVSGGSEVNYGLKNPRSLNAL